MVTEWPKFCTVFVLAKRTMMLFGPSKFQLSCPEVVRFNIDVNTVVAANNVVHRQPKRHGLQRPKILN